MKLNLKVFRSERRNIILQHPCTTMFSVSTNVNTICVFLSSSNLHQLLVKSLFWSVQSGADNVMFFGSPLN